MFCPKYIHVSSMTSCQCASLDPGAQLWSRLHMYLMYLRLCQELSMPVAIEKSAAWVRAGLHPKNYGYPLLSCKKSPLSSNPGWARGQPPRGNTFSPLHSTASLHHGCPVTAPSCHASSLMPLRHIMHNATPPKLAEL